MPQVTREELPSQVGVASKATKWFMVTQDQINQFADCTLDQQFIHTNPEEAAKTPFGSTIAHGFLTLSMLSYFSESYSIIIDGFFMGMDTYTFKRPQVVENSWAN